MTENETQKPFNLLRWFAWLSPIAILVIALANAWLISNFLNNHLFQREATVSRDFVQNILLSDDSLEYLSRPDDPVLKSRFINTRDHLSNMRDVLRANVYSTDRAVLWSTDPQLVGQRFAENEELDEAMAGKLVVHAGRIDSEKTKEEHVGLDPSIRFFVESYIPIVRPGNGGIVGVVELYKAPLALTEAIQEGQLQVGLAAVVSALALYLCLFGLIRRADGIIKCQHAQLLETETLAVVGELTSSVAHNIRNPLSSIRSAAELTLESPNEDCTEQARDIIREVDRISGRITELLRLSEKNVQRVESVDLSALLLECVSEHRPRFEQRGQSLELSTDVGIARITADPALLKQVFYSLLSNATEAMSAAGHCVVRMGEVDRHRWRIEITDKGAGLAPDAAAQVFRPFFTTKPQGLGLGLPLAKRIIERFGGTITFGSQLGIGSRMTILLPKN
jgi:signal transduction histidine kinase